MGNAHNLPTNNLVVFLQLEDNKKTTDFLKEKIAHDPDYINSPINKMKDTILHYAAYKENRDLVEFLLQHNAKIDIKNSRGLTACDVCESNLIKNIINKKK